MGSPATGRHVPNNTALATGAPLSPCVPPAPIAPVPPAVSSPMSFPFPRHSVSRPSDERSSFAAFARQHGVPARLASPPLRVSVAVGPLPRALCTNARRLRSQPAFSTRDNRCHREPISGPCSPTHPRRPLRCLRPVVAFVNFQIDRVRQNRNYRANGSVLSTQKDESCAKSPHVHPPRRPTAPACVQLRPRAAHCFSRLPARRGWPGKAWVAPRGSK